MAKALFTATTEDGTVDLVGPDGHGGAENSVLLLLKNADARNYVFSVLDIEKAEELGKSLLEWSMNARKSLDDHEHTPIQHRDGKAPWCRKCGLAADYREPVSIFDRKDRE